MKLVTVVGARPQFIKAAPFSEVFRKEDREVLVHTGQHYDPNMSDVFFEELGIPRPDYHLGIGSGSHGAQTGRMLEAIEQVLEKEKPDGLLVYGDTNSTLAGALAASKMHIPVFHVEAGLRSYDRRMPEEQNRVVTDHLSTFLFCPTRTAVENLTREGIVQGVFETGDIMYDAVLRNRGISTQRFRDGSWRSELRAADGMAVDLREKEYDLATIHRAENTDDPARLRTIFTAFSRMDRPVLLPLHPRTRRLAADLDLPLENVVVVEPVGYLLMLYLTAQAHGVLTDSGGLQKEAYFLRVPCTTLRSTTEWVETLDDGWNQLAEIDVDAILAAARRPMDTEKAQPSRFGDGHAAERMTQKIKETWPYTAAG